MRRFSNEVATAVRLRGIPGAIEMNALNGKVIIVRCDVFIHWMAFFAFSAGTIAI